MGRIKYETWEKLFETADEVRETEPWKYLDAADLIALHFKDRGSVYVNVLGYGRKLYGLHMFDGEEELVNLLRYMYYGKLGYTEREALGKCDLLAVEWDEARFLGKDEKQALRKLGRTYPDRQWPGFFRYGRNIRFYEIDSRDTDLVERSMRALIDLTKSYFSALPDMQFLDVITVFECVEQEDGSWRVEQTTANENILLTKTEQEQEKGQKPEEREKAEGVSFGMFEIKEQAEEDAGSAIMIVDLRSFLPVSVSPCEPGDTAVRKYERALAQLAGSGLRTPAAVRLRQDAVDDDVRELFSRFGIILKTAVSFGNMETFLKYGL